MMDLTEKESGSQEAKKCCVDCKTTKTPLWRGGPAGPKTLCNACGIKQRKKRRALMGTTNKEGAGAGSGSGSPSGSGSGSEQEKESSSSNSKKKENLSTSKRKGKENNKMDVTLKLRLLTLGRQVLLRRSSLEKQRKLKLCEEEEAAILLMALSYGPICA